MKEPLMSTPSPSALPVDTVVVGGIALAVEHHGAGPGTVVVVHGEDGTVFLDPFVTALAATQRVVVVHLPGWGVSPPDETVTGVDDLAMVLDDYVMDHAPGADVVGISFGAWVVAHAAAVHGTGFGKVALVAPVGIKTVARDERSYVDLWANSDVALRDALYGDGSRAPDLTTAADETFLRLAHANEAVARHAWEPYLHDPKLAHRLRRLEVPTLVVTGRDDRFVLEPQFGERWVERIGPNAQHVVVDGAGHRVEEEAPTQLAEIITGFLAAPSA
jgi:pimeloyl-ACP methyl ester carboxylesterase